MFLLPASDLSQAILRNGVHVLLHQNSNPVRHVSLRLCVAVGSYCEEEHERGFAHFVEHLAFRHTRTMTTENIVGYLQSVRDVRE
jgi:zinc protease